MDDITNETFYSKFHFTRKFMELTGWTPGAYLRKRRLEEAAKDILAGSDILQVAVDYHFGSQQAFTRSFKAYFRTTPGFYRDMRVLPVEKGEPTMIKELENLRGKNKWTTHLGCLGGCLDYLKRGVSDAWLFGATGHAFILNIPDGVQASGPTAWDTQKMLSLVSNLGGKIKTISQWKHQTKDFAKVQEEAWNLVRQSIDAGNPCYSFGFVIHDYFVIYGYDDTGYYYSGPGCDRDTGSVPWQELGDNDVPWIDLHAVSPVPVADDTKTVKDALEFALEFSKYPNKWLWESCKSGLVGYDSWIQSLADGKANTYGVSYNTVVWLECRELGVQFLREASRRLGGAAVKPLEEAAEHYETVSRQLRALTKLYPMPGGLVEDKELRKKAVTLLRNARDAEAYGLASLEKVVSAL